MLDLKIVKSTRQPTGALRVEYTVGGRMFRAFRSEGEAKTHKDGRVRREIMWRIVQVEPQHRILGSTRNYDKRVYDHAIAISKELNLPIYPEER